MNVQIKMDYQPVNGITIPHKVTYGIVGAYSILLEFVGCSTTKSSESLAIPINE